MGVLTMDDLSPLSTRRIASLPVLSDVTAHRTDRVLNAIMTERWAILPDALEQIITIGQRLNEDPEAVSARLGRPLDNSRTATERDGVAVIPVIGPIFRYANIFTEISGAASVQVLAKDLRAALDNPGIDAVLLEVDSPGGMVAGISEFAEMVRQADKPVTAYVSDLGASAAYWIASAADRLVVRDTARVGSIGVAAMVRTDKAPNTMEIISTQSPRKRPDPNEPQGRADLQQQIDDLAQIFVETVARNRGVDTQTVLESFGMGGLLVGAQAVAAGMADSLGSFEDLIAGISGTSAQTRRIEMTVKEEPAITFEMIAEQHPDIAEAFRSEGAKASNDAMAEKSAEIKADGAKAERERIQAVEDQGFPGHEALIASLKFDGQTTGEQAAVQVLKAEREKHAGMLSGIRSDAAHAFVKVAPPPPPAPSAVDPNLPLDERCKAEWDRTPDLRTEFGSLPVYMAFKRAEDNGQIHVLKRAK